MSPIRVAVRACIPSLFPQDLHEFSPPRLATPGQPQRPQSHDNGLRLPSFRTPAEIDDAFAIADRIWAQAAIEFTPATIARQVAPADENGMWARFVNRLSPPSGIVVGFVYDLPGRARAISVNGEIRCIQTAP